MGDKTVQIENIMSRSILSVVVELAKRWQLVTVSHLLEMCKSAMQRLSLRKNWYAFS